MWGAAAGAVAMTIVGFSQLGWFTAGSADRMAQDRADTAVVAALVPFCVTKAQADPDHAVLVKVMATGLCRSDWHGWQGHDPDIRLPHVPGHELAGHVVAVGKDVVRWRTGDRVTVPFVSGCGHEGVTASRTSPGRKTLLAGNTFGSELGATRGGLGTSGDRFDELRSAWEGLGRLVDA